MTLATFDKEMNIGEVHYLDGDDLGTHIIRVYGGWIIKFYEQEYISNFDRWDWELKSTCFVPLNG
jgi:hypothetical protein